MTARPLDMLLLATLAVLTFEKVRWETPAATLTLTNLLAGAFVLAFLTDRVRRRDFTVPPTAITLTGFMAAFLAVYLAGYFDLQNRQALSFWLKGIGAWTVHFAYLVCGVAHMARRGRALYMRAVAFFVGGLVVNCVYGFLQFALQIAAGVNLDSIVVGPLTAGQGGIGGLRVYGRAAGHAVYRVNALTGDTNHLGIMLCAPLLMLLPVYLRDSRRRRRLGLLLLGMFAMQVLTLSRSAALGDVVGLAVLTPFIRPHLPSARRLAIGAAAILAAGLTAFEGVGYVHTIVTARVSLSGGATATHLEFYQLVPPALDPHPLFGMGFNTFSVFYQFITGRSDFGAHSMWVATLVETGLVGLCVYLAYFAYTVASAARMRFAVDPDLSRLGYGITAALVGTAAANTFYLTMPFDYFFALVLLAVAGATQFVPVTRSAPIPAGAAVSRGGGL